jgi:hypothetical protein
MPSIEHSEGQEAKVDNNLALSLLSKALAKVSQPSFTPSYSRTKELKALLLGSHLTYRYMLITAVLGKAADSRIHPRAVQAGSSLKGAYDARSLCHGILVPFERKHLNNALGGSNEPYLNKPARCTSLELTNPVRAGKDKAALTILVRILEELNKQTSELAFVALCDCIFYTKMRGLTMTALLPDSENKETGLQKIIQFVGHFSVKSIEGETCAVLTGAILTCLQPLLGKTFEVRVHPTNQAGSSSKEISDVDAYLLKQLKYTIEVKDKTFSLEDLGHAVKKVAQAGHNSLIFVMGPRGFLKDGAIEDAEERFSSDTMSVACISIGSFARSILSLVPDTTPLEFYRALTHHCKSARVKDETIKHLNQCAKSLGWI